MQRGAWIIITTCSSFLLKGQDNNIATDRPGEGESSSVVSRGVLQIETGVAFSKHEIEFFNGTIEKTRDFGTTLIRYGVFQDIEVRIATAVTNYEESTFIRNTGLQPITVGTKIALHPQKGLRPELALLGHITLPWIGDEQLVPDFIAPDFRLCLSHALSERFSLGYNLGMSWDGNSPRGSFVYTLSLEASLVEQVSAFAEIYGEGLEGLGWTHHADFGVSVLMTPDLQFDVSYGLTLSRGLGRKTHFLNAGISTRFGGKK
ncbi:MAG TPA: transporter [Saprospiraceae bacterium]|nr:transporter [Saprospiraceae bacterium]